MHYYCREFTIPMSSTSHFDELCAGSQLPVEMIRNMIDKFNIEVVLFDSDKKYYNLKCKTCQKNISRKYLNNLKGQMEEYHSGAVYYYYSSDIKEHVKYFISEAVLHFIDIHSDSYVYIGNDADWDIILRQIETFKQTIMPNSDTNLTSSAQIDVVTNIHNKLKSILEIKQLKEQHVAQLSKLKEEHNIQLNSLRDTYERLADFSKENFRAENESRGKIELKMRNDYVQTLSKLEAELYVVIDERNIVQNKLDNIQLQVKIDEEAHESQ